MANNKIPTATPMKIVLKKTKKIKGFNVKYMLEGGGGCPCIVSKIRKIAYTYIKDLFF